MGKKKIIIVVSIIIALTTIITIGIVRLNIVNAKKINNSIELGIKSLIEENYDEAKAQFSKILSIDEDHKKAIELQKLTEECMELDYLCKNKEYILASELISKLKVNKYLELIEEKINSISVQIEEKLMMIGKIDNIENDINPLVSENKYDEAIKLVEKYINEDLKEEYLIKLNNLKNSINDSKSAYEEKKRIAEQQRVEEKKKAEEKKKLKEQQKAESKKQTQTQNQTTNNVQQMISKETVKKILDGYINNYETTFENYDSPIVFEKNGVVYWAYKQIWRGESGTFLIIDMYTGKVIVSEKLDFDHGDADFYYPGY